MWSKNSKKCTCGKLIVDKEDLRESLCPRQIGLVQIDKMSNHNE